MRKNQVRQILYLWIVAVIFGCSSPEFLLEDQKNSNQNIKMEILNPETIKKHPRLFTKISKHNDVILLRNTNERNVSSSVYNFTINTNLCKMITVDSIVTYTFYVMREEDNGLFENLVLREKPDGTYLAKLLQYDITEAEKQLILNGVDVNLNNKISSTVINDADFISDVTSRIYYSPTGQCYDVTSVYVPGNMCASGDHAFGDPTCHYLLSGQTSNQATAGTNQLVYTEMDCGGGGGGPSGPGDDGGIGAGGGTSPTGPSLPEVPLTDPCNDLKNLSTKNVTSPNISGNIISLLNDLKTKSVPVNSEFHQKGETGYCVFPGDNASNFTAQGFTTPPNSVGTENIFTIIGFNYLSFLMHTHGTEHYSCYSLDDIYSVYQLLKTPMGFGTVVNNADAFSSFLVTAHGVNYAMKITDKQAFINWGDFFFANWEFDNVKDANNVIYFMNMVKPKLNFTNTDIETNDTEVAKFFKGKGIELYKNDGDFTTWKKISINNYGIKEIKPCK